MLPATGLVDDAEFPAIRRRLTDARVASYDTADQSITVAFSNGTVYLYTYASAGLG